jgi:hypothetical protein
VLPLSGVRPYCQQLPTCNFKFKKQERLCAPVAALEAANSQLRLSSRIVDGVVPCIVVDVRLNGSNCVARALIDTGANSCFASKLFCNKNGIDFQPTNQNKATLANSTSATILGKTAPQQLSMPGLNASVVFQVLDSLDGVDLVLGLIFLSTHCIDVLSKNLSLSIPQQHGPPVAVNTAPQAPMFESFSTEQLDFVSGSRLAHLVAHEDCDVFLGYIKELNNHQNSTDTTPDASRPQEYVLHEEDLLKEYGDVLREDIPPGLPPERRLRDGRKIEHAIPLKPDSKPVSQQTYKLFPTELDEVQRTLNRLTQQGWIRPSLSPWGSPVLFQRKKSGKLRMCIDYKAKPLSQHNDHLDSKKGGAYRYALLQYIHRHDEGLATVIIAFNLLHV